jgi:nucleotide-binding universal stress UspA family protein
LSESNYRQAYYKTLTEAESLVADVAKHLKRMGVTDVVGKNIVEGSVVNVILNVAKIRKPDLLVIGAWEPSIGPNATQDSVSKTVAECAACPVMIVK